MTNADKFKKIFGIYATELWAMPEADFLKWLNTDRKTEPTISKMEQVDKDINVRSKDEPQTERPWGMYIVDHPMYE